MDYLTDNSEFNAKLEKQVTSLPRELQELIKSESIDAFVSSVGARYSLSETEEEAVLHEMGLIFMKIEPVESFFTNLLSEALVDPIAAKDIVEEATEEFFTPFAEQLKMSVQSSPTAPSIPTGVPLGEKPYVETPVKKAAYGAMLDVPNYGAVPPLPPQPKPVPFIPETPAIRVQPTFEKPTGAARPPQRGLIE